MCIQNRATFISDIKQNKNSFLKCKIHLFMKLKRRENARKNLCIIVQMRTVIHTHIATILPFAYVHISFPFFHALFFISRTTETRFTEQYLNTNENINIARTYSIIITFYFSYSMPDDRKFFFIFLLFPAKIIILITFTYLFPVKTQFKRFLQF